MKITLSYKGEGDGMTFSPTYPLMFKEAFNKAGIQCDLVRDKDDYLYLGVPADNFFRDEYQVLAEMYKDFSGKELNFKDLEIDFTNCPKVDLYGTMTAIGCKYKCKFCPNSTMGYVVRDKDKVLRELRWICSNTNYFEFFDNNVLLSPIFLDVIENIPKGTHWGALINIVDITEDLKSKLKKMYKYGCRNIYIGLETFVKEDLEYFGKPYTGKVDSKQFMAMLQSLGFNVYAFIIRGLPSETTKSFKDLVGYLKDNGIYYGVNRFHIDGEEVTETEHLTSSELLESKYIDAVHTSCNLKRFILAGRSEDSEEN